MFTKLDDNLQPLEPTASDWTFVKDENTGLVYTKGGRNAVTLEHAQGVAQELAARFPDARLPSPVEALAMADLSATPTLDKAFFPFVGSKNVWTNSSVNATEQRIVNFRNGTVSITNVNTTRRFFIVFNPLVSG